MVGCSGYAVCSHGWRWIGLGLCSGLGVLWWVTAAGKVGVKSKKYFRHDEE